MLEISNEVLITKVGNSDTGAVTAKNSSIVNMTGFSAVTFVCGLGTVTQGSVLTLTAYENTVSSTSGATTVAGGASTTVTAGTAASNTTILVDVIRPSLPYVYCTLTRTTQTAAVDSIYALQYRTTSAPVTQPASTLAQQLSTPEV